MTSSGTVIVNMAAGGVSDTGGNTNLASNTGTTINYTHLITGATVNPNAGNAIIGQTVSVTLTTAGAVTGLFAGTGSTINGVSVTSNFTDNADGTYTFTYAPSNGDPTWALNALPISLRLNDGTNTTPPRTTFTGGSASATDLTRPSVNSRSVGTITPTGATFTINLNEIGTTYWEVTTSATPPTPAQILAGTGPGHVSNGNFAVGTASTNINQAIGGLSSATAYFIYSVSTDGVGNQSTPVTSDGFTTLCAPPTAQPTAAGSPFTAILANSMTVNWVRGDGTGGVLVVARQGGAPAFFPNSGQTYAGQVNANFSLATDQGGGDKIVYRGSGTSVNVTGLSPSTTYHYAVYEWNTANDCYLVTSPLTQSQSTIAVANESTLANASGTATISSLAVSTGTSVAVFSFDVTDAGADGSETRITQFIFRPGTGNDFPDFTHLIAPTGVELYDNAGNGPGGTLTVGTNTITFASIPAATGQLGNVPNGTTKRYTLRVFFNNPLNAAIRATADEENLVLDLASGDVTTAGGFSGMSASTVNSGSGNGVIDVLATRLAFVAGPVNTLLLVPMATVTVEAVDINGARDNGFTSTVGIISTGTLTTSPVDATYVAGLGTYNTITHSAVAAARTLTTNSGSITNPVSAAFNITASNASDIIVDGGFVYPTNIAYDTYQESSNITVSGTSIEVGRFTIRDGGVGLNDGDLAPTILSQLTLDFGANFALLRRVELYDATGTVAIPGTEFPVSTQTITFGGLNLTANDNATTGFTVRASFRSLVTDNAQFSIAIANPTSTQANVSSTFPSPAGAVTSTAGNNNRVEVVAAQYRFIQQPTSSDVNAIMAPSPTVEAVDALLNRDVDYVSSVDMLSTGSLTVSPQSATFVLGVGTYNSIVHNLSGSGLNLVTNGPLANVVSSGFQIVAQSSNITATPLFVYPSNIAYNNHQESVNITSAGTSLVVASFNINDGGAAFPDGDLAFTVLTGLQLDLGPNFAFIRRIALYNATGLVEIPGTEQVVGSQIVNFGGLSLAAPDDGTTTFTVRVSFNAPVIDRQQFSLTVDAATSQAGNSRFAFPDAGGATTSVAGDDNKIQVTANRMMFIQQPTNTLNGVTMSPPVTVGAADPLGSIDIDFASPVDITSNGVLSVSPQTAAFVNGIGTYNSIVHTSNGFPLVLTTNSGLINVNSNNFQISSSATSDITSAVFPYPTNIAYQNFQEAFNILNSPTSLNVARFDVRDGGGAADLDQAPTVLNSLSLDLGTNFTFIRRIALYDATGTFEIPGTEQNVVAQIVNFGGFAISAADGGSTAFTVRVSFRNTVTDNQQFSFTVTAAGTSPNVSSTFALPTAGGATSSVAGDNNRIEVTATQIIFATNLNSPLLAGINVSTQQPNPVVHTVDGFGNIDRDYATNLTITCGIGISTSTLVRDVAAPNAGVYSFPAFQYTPQTGNGTLTISGPTLVSALSNAVTVVAGAATQIVAGGAAPATISSLTVTSPGVAVFNFDIQDDRPPVAGTNNDGLPTMFNQLVITANAGFNTITDWTQAIAGARLSDGTNFLDVGAAAVSNTPNSITFTGIPTGVGLLGHVADNATKSYTLSIHLRSSMLGALPATVDGLQFQFEVFSSNITPVANSTTFVATNTNSGNANVVSVIADRLRFIAPAFPASASLNTNFPGLIVEATDQYNNRDRGFTGAGSTVREVSNATAAAFINQPLVGTTQFGTGANLGLLLFNNNFQYTTGSNGDDVSLTVKAGPGPGTTCGVNGIICVTQAPNSITLQASFESSIVQDPTFVNPLTIDYAYRQENSNITASASSIEIAKMLLVDGSRVGPPFSTFTDSGDGIPNDDLDGASTRLNSLTLRITNPANLRRIALYSAGSEIPGTEINVTSIVPIVPGTPSYDFVFAGAPLLIAPDGGQADITVRASFRNTAGFVTDRDPIDVSVVAATLGTGSSFFVGGGYIAGWPGGFQTPPGRNIVDVVATKFDFTTQPASGYAGKEPQPFNAGSVQARDQWSLLDTDFNEDVNIFSSVAVSPPLVTFSGGLLDLPAMLYNGVGDGTLTVSYAGGTITSELNNTVLGLANDAQEQNPVQVIHVSTTEATNGVVSTTNLTGGTFNHIIFGVTFRSQIGVAATAPLLEDFVFSFSNPITGVFLNTGADFPRVYESTDDTYDPGVDVDITTGAIGGSLTVGTSTIAVNLGAGRDLSATNAQLTYFLEVDIDPVASGSTPNVQPSVTDAGFGSPTDANIVTNFGSATSSVSGKTYSFAAIFPPVLISSYPATGQLNVDPNQSTISLTFGVPVWTLDSRILLFDQTAGTGPFTCVATNGEYLGGFGTASNTLNFTIPMALIANHVYFVTVAPGNLENLTGIIDEANNAYPGFSFPGTLYFKAASPIPPKLLGPGTTPSAPVGPYVSNITLNGATINATLDQQGTVYYMILKPGSPSGPPTNTQIRNPGTYGSTNYIAGAGNFNVVQTNPISQFGLVTPVTTGLPGPIPPANQFLPNTTYEVWMFAENNSLPTPFETTAPYGSSAVFHAVGAAGPTMTFTTPNTNPAGPGIVSGPTVSVCNNSFQIINQPIVISENVTGLFNTFGAEVSMNIGLPAGYQFDVSKTGGVPTYGRLNLLGADFVAGSGSIDFLGNGTLRIRYRNNGIGTLDKIIISNLRVFATGSSTGNMFRIGGTALTGPIPDGTNMGTLTSFDAPLIGFDNTYSKYALGRDSINVVTSMPDNADDLFAGTGPGTIALIPVNPNINDFGPNSFSGLGVNINLLSLSAVTPDVPFNITITHTDNNGCISNNSIQYTVYDNERAVKMSLTVPNPPLAGLPPTNFVQSPFCVENTNFINTRSIVNPYNPPVLNSDLKYVAFNNLAGYYLRNSGPGSTGDGLTAKIPSNAPATQIIYGPKWAPIINNLPVATGALSNIPGSAPPTTQSFYIDVATILNAPSIDPTIPDPYSHFKDSTALGNYFYNGGSLGVIELTGTYQSKTNATVIVPRTQIVEIFVPPVPLVEASISNRTYLDASDIDNPIGSGGINGPSNFGTNVYCQAGGVINIDGYPKALPGKSLGSFTLIDHITGDTIFHESSGLTPLGFTDFGNGTAVLNPNIPTSGPGSDATGAVRNDFKDIRVVYTYLDLAAPNLCERTAYQVIRITPNPVAAFTVTTPLTSFVENSSARCVGQAIQFTSTATVNPADATASVIDYSWDFGEVTSGTNIILFDSTTYPAPPPGATPAPFHTFAAPSGSGSPYLVKHLAISNYGCLSGPPVGPTGTLSQNVPFEQGVNVGAIPDVRYKLEGVSTADSFKFNSNNELMAFPPIGNFGSVNPFFSTKVSANDSIRLYFWQFGDGGTLTLEDEVTSGIDGDPSFNESVVTHTYATPGPRQIDLTVTSYLGCVNKLSFQSTYRSIVVLDRKVLLPGSAYVEDFEANDGGWQVWGTGNDTTEMKANTLTSSWQWGTWNELDPLQRIAFPEQPEITDDNIWKTNLPAIADSGFYNAKEKSAVYSPSFDLTSLTRPMISFTNVVQLADGDGVVLEYSLDNLNVADPNKTWHPLGVIDSGEDWYTAQGLAGRPGTQPQGDYGWSGSTNRAWQSPKHVLDTMFNYPGVQPNKAVFRFALGSAATFVNLRGFALDNVRVGDRTRTILLESFSSVSNPSPSEKAENDYVAAFVGNVGTEVVKLNYHLNFPGKDPFNEDNPADPSSRALFYNITATPRSVLDGEKDPQDRKVSVWGLPLYNLRTLQLAQADIAINTTTDPDGSLSIGVDVTSRVLTGLQPNTLLHVVVLEDSVPLSALPSGKQAMVSSSENGFEYVVKKMLPNASGTLIGAVLPDGQSRSFGPFVWRPESSKLYPNPDDLVVAVFLQESTPPYEVYQVELVGPINDPPVVTGLEPIAEELVLVYPNPANREMTVQLPGQLSKPASVQLIDQTGRTALQSSIPEGSDRKTLNVSDLSGGMYILTVDMGQGVLTRKKVMIVHQD